MVRRNLEALDRDIGQDWSRIIMEYFRDGSSGAVISQGGLVTGQTAHGPLEVSATQVYTLGTKLEQDNKVYRYSKCSTATAGVAGTLVESSEFLGGNGAFNVDLVISTGTAAEGTTVYADLDSTGGATANAYAEGHYIVSAGNATGGLGACHKIVSNVGIATSGGDSFVLEEALVVGTVAGTSKATVISNIYKNWLKTPASTPLGIVLGVPRCTVPVATPYCWLQTRGVAAALVTTGQDSSRGLAVTRDFKTAGSVSQGGGTTGLGSDIVGYAIGSATVSQEGAVFLTIE